MEGHSPPTLVKLARQRLLKEDLIISALGDLTIRLFPALFEEAFFDRRTNVLRAMVCAWPFTSLPVGALIKNPHLENLKALLAGLDVLITEKVRPRKSKLRVFDLTDVHQDFWNPGAGTHEGDYLPQVERQKQSVEICPNSGVKKRFNVVTDLEIRKAKFKKCDKYVLQWVRRRKRSVHLCCRMLKILDSSVSTATLIFKKINLSCVLELWLSQWSLEFLAQLLPYLEKMRNLHTLALNGVWKPLGFAAATEQEWISMLLSQISKLHCLQNLSVYNVYFITGCLEEWLRCLKTPLKTLSITDCQLSHSDLDHLSQCLNISELRHLNLSLVVLSDACPKLLGVLLERIASTLQTLELGECEMRDCHFNAILPSLSQCSQLTHVNFYHNNISLLVLKNLLHHTAKLSKLTREMYPAPLECYKESRILRDKFTILCPELLDILRAKRQPKNVSFATRICLDCFYSCFYDLEAKLCLCS